MANIPLDEIPNAQWALIPEAGSTASEDASVNTDTLFAQLADRKAMSKNYADLARADDVMQNARAAHSEESASLPEGQWVPLWENKYRPQVEQQIVGLNLSPWSQEHVTPQLIKFDAATRTNLAYDAHKAELNRDAEAMANQFNRQTAAGQYEQAHGTLYNMEHIGHITPEQSADMWAQTEKAQRINGASTVMAQDPAGMLADMQQAQKDRKSNWFPWMTPNEINLYAEMAQNHVQDSRVKKSNDIYEGIAAGTILDDKTLHANAGNLFDDDQTQRFKTALKAWPQYDPQTASTLRTAVANYDPATDQDASQYHNLLAQIATTLPRNTQGTLQQELAQQYTDSKNRRSPELTRRLRGDLYATVDGMAAQGLLQTGGSDITTVYQKAGQLQDDIDTYLKNSPDVSIPDAKSWLMSRIGSDAQKLATTKPENPLQVGRDYIETLRESHPNTPQYNDTQLQIIGLKLQQIQKLKQQSQDTLYPQTTTDAIYNAVKRGWLQGQTAIELQKPSPDVARIADLQHQASLLKPTREFEQTWSEKVPARESLSAFIKDPVGNLTQLVAEGLGAQIPTQGAFIGKVSERALEGAVIGGGGFVLGPEVGVPTTVVGAEIGAMTGYAESNMLATRASEYAGSLLNSLKENGVDVTNEASLRNALKNPELMERISAQAESKAVPPALVSGVLSVIGGRLFTAPAKTITGKAAQWGGELATQVLGNMAGELWGQKNETGTISSPKAVVATGAGQLANSAAHVVVGKSGGLIHENIHEILRNIETLERAEEAKFSKRDFASEDNFPTSKQSLFNKEPIVFKGIKVYQRNDINWNFRYKNGYTNLQRAQDGRAPYGKDIEFLNVHHIGQKPESVVEATQTIHQKYSAILHKNNSRSKIDRIAFNKWKRSYWKERARLEIQKRTEK